MGYYGMAWESMGIERCAARTNRVVSDGRPRYGQEGGSRGAGMADWLSGWIDWFNTLSTTWPLWGKLLALAGVLAVIAGGIGAIISFWNWTLGGAINRRRNRQRDTERKAAQARRDEELHKTRAAAEAAKLGSAETLRMADATNAMLAQVLTRNVPVVPMLPDVIQEEIFEIMSKNLGFEKSNIKLDSSLIDDLGVDSLDCVELIMACEEKFQIEVKDEDVEKFVTVGDVIAYVRSTRRA